MEVLAAVLRPPPTEEDAVGDPLIFRVDQRAEFGPIGALGVFREFQRVALGRVELGLVEGVEAIRLYESYLTNFAFANGADA